jgi:hypothetical protein
MKGKSIAFHSQAGPEWVRKTSACVASAYVPNADRGWGVHRAAHGYEPTREAAKAAFAKSWHRET